MRLAQHTDADLGVQTNWSIGKKNALGYHSVEDALNVVGDALSVCATIFLRGRGFNRFTV